MHGPQTLLAALLLGIAFATHSGATVYSSDGSEANVQRLGKVASHGDVITLPAGTFTWTNGVNITKGITLSGQTTITGAGTANCTADDQTIIIDEKRRSAPGALLKAAIPAGRSFRLTGITFRRGSVNTAQHHGGAVAFSSSGGLVSSARMDHCHFDTLAWEEAVSIDNWIYGVDDHNLFDCGRRSISHIIRQGSWNNKTQGHGSWADFPYYGSEKFWFIEDNTIKGAGGGISGGIDCSTGGRYVARHNYFLRCNPNGHGTEGGFPIRGMRCYEVYNNVFNFPTGPTGVQAHRSGSGIWHDNTFLGPNSTSTSHTSLPYYREFNGVGDLQGWGLADGENGWDSNDPHGLYFNGTAASNTTIVEGKATFATGTIMTPKAYRGMQVRNDNAASACYLHSSFIISNTATTITYFYQASQAKPPLSFNSGDEFSIRNVLIGLDQAGRGKGDLISATGTRHWPNRGKGDLISATRTRHWPNQQRETCFSWNNKNTDTNQVLGFNSSIPTQHEGSDYVNLGAGLPGDQIPAQVTAAYPAEVNGGSAYTQEYVYPHPLVTGGPTPTPIPGSSPTATATATHTFHRAGRRHQ